jgi:hypothetical protein
MTKEEYIVAIKEAETTINNLVREARSNNIVVDLTVTIEAPMSTVSLVSVIVK